MSIPIIAFFNNKGGVGKTSLVYHAAWMMSELGLRVLAADLDPQCNLTSAFLDEDRLEELWPDDDDPPTTVYGAIRPLQKGIGDVTEPVLQKVAENLSLVAGDMLLSGFEDGLSEAWPKCLDRDERSFRVISSFWRVVQMGAERHGANVVLIDLGPNLGAINRAALIASDYVVIPLGPDLFSLQGLKNLGPALRNWREGWKERIPKNPSRKLNLPKGDMQPLGYIVMQHSVRQDRPVKAYEKWVARIPFTYRNFVLDQNLKLNRISNVVNDPHCFSLIRHYRSLMPMAQEARKPMFFLKPADGAIGSHAKTVQDVYRDFEGLTKKILSKAGILQI
jgi:cellulose biosynthesis protein BcsQ